MPDPFWLIVGLIAIATIVLWPVRIWIASRYGRREDPGATETPLAPPKRRNRG